MNAKKKKLRSFYALSKSNPCLLSHSRDHLVGPPKGNGVFATFRPTSSSRQLAQPSKPSRNCIPSKEDTSLYQQPPGPHITLPSKTIEPQHTLPHTRNNHGWRTPRSTFWAMQECAPQTRLMLWQEQGDSSRKKMHSQPRSQYGKVCAECTFQRLDEPCHECIFAFLNNALCFQQASSSQLSNKRWTLSQWSFWNSNSTA